MSDLARLALRFQEQAIAVEMRYPDVPAEARPLLRAEAKGLRSAAEQLLREMAND